MLHIERTSFRYQVCPRCLPSQTFSQCRCAASTEPEVVHTENVCNLCGLVFGTNLLCAAASTARREAAPSTTSADIMVTVQVAVGALLGLIVGYITGVTFL